jgi:WD40 repeat protein
MHQRWSLVTNLLNNRDLVAVCQAEAKLTSQLSDIGGNLVTCGVDGAIRTWTQEGGLVKTFAAHEAPVRGLAKIGRFAVTAGSKDGRLKVWDWENEEWLFDLQDPVHMVSLITTAYEKLAVASWDKNGLHHIQVWELDEIQEVAPKHINREKPL